MDRRSIRLPGHDYSNLGAYFVTICAYQRRCLFGEVADGEMRLNGVGCMIQKVWDEIPAMYSGVGIDAFIIMPNHVHGIIWLNEMSPDPVGAGPRACPSPEGQPQGVAPTGKRLSLPDVVHRFKSLSATRHRVMRSEGPDGNMDRQRLWQRNYYERVIRRESELEALQSYIFGNPAKWSRDPENPHQ